MASVEGSTQPRRADESERAARLQRPRRGHALPAVALVAFAALTVAIVTAGCGGSGHSGAQASTHAPASRNGTQRPATRAQSTSRATSSHAAVHVDRASRPSAHRPAQRSFRAAADAICETLTAGANGQTVRRGSPSGAPSIYEAQQAAFRIELAIRKLSQLRPPGSASAAVSGFVLALRRLQVLGLQSVRASQRDANALSSAIARAEQQASSAAAVAGLPACAHLQAATASAQASIPGQPITPGQGPLPGQPGIRQQNGRGQSVPSQRVVPWRPSERSDMPGRRQR